MKCPLTFKVDRKVLGGVIARGAECLKQDCALWEKTGEVCSVLSIEHQLDGIRTALFDIYGKTQQ